MAYSQENSYQKELLRVKELRTSPRYIVHRNKQKWNILCFQNFFNIIRIVLMVQSMENYKFDLRVRGLRDLFLQQNISREMRV